MKEAGVVSAAGSAAVSGVVLLGGQCAPLQPGEPPPGASPEGRNVQILSGELPPNGHAPAQVFGAAPGDHEDTFYHPGPGIGTAIAISLLSFFYDLSLLSEKK